MVKSLDLRKMALSHFQNGKKAPEIATLLANRVHRSTIDRRLRRHQQTGSFEPKPKLGQPKTGRTKRLNNLVKKRLDSNNTRKSLRTMAKDFNSSVQTIKRVLIIDLKKKCYRKITPQKLKENQKPIRKTCCQWIRKNINHNKLKIMMFTDEKKYLPKMIISIQKTTSYGLMIDPMLLNVVDCIPRKNIQYQSWLH